MVAAVAPVNNLRMGAFFQKTTLSMAIAIFSMFFGAGNAIFPLVLGRQTGDYFGWAFLGLLVTGIGGPLLGLIGGTLYRGQCIEFFGRAGKIGGPLLIFVTLGLLGPFAVLPRCVIVAHAAVLPLFPSFPLWVFSLLLCFLGLLFCFRRTFLLPVLGYVLSPILIGSLLMISCESLFSPTAAAIDPTMSQGKAFLGGISTGYATMDLIASIYFSAGIWTMIQLHSNDKSPKTIFSTTFKSGILGCLFLALIYWGLTHAAAVYADNLEDVPPAQMMSHLANTALGTKMGLVANLAIILACFTTIISLVMTIADIFSKQISQKQFSYKTLIIVQLVITALIAPIGFDGIMSAIHYPIMIAYPLIIVLTIYNIMHKIRAPIQLVN